jgi:hypothetical protein
MTNRTRTLVGGAAFSLALAGGGVAGALLGTPGVSGAQDDTTTTTAAAAEDHAARPFRHHRGERLGTAATALGMTADELRAELEEGRSIAQVAEERDVDVQVVVDALVAEGTERLEAAIAELPERAAELVEREGLPGRGHGHARERIRSSLEHRGHDDAAEEDDDAET